MVEPASAVISMFDDKPSLHRFHGHRDAELPESQESQKKVGVQSGHDYSGILQGPIAHRLDGMLADLFGLAELILGQFFKFLRQRELVDIDWCYALLLILKIRHVSTTPFRNLDTLAWHWTVNFISNTQKSICINFPPRETSCATLNHVICQTRHSTQNKFTSQFGCFNFLFHKVLSQAVSSLVQFRLKTIQFFLLFC